MRARLSMAMAILVAGSISFALPVVAGKPYIIVLNGGREMQARQPPVYRGGMAYFYTASGNTYTAIPEKQIDRNSTVAANAEAAPPPSAAPQQSLADVKLKKEKTGELRKLERTSKPAAGAAPAPADPAATAASATPGKALTDAELEKLLLAELERQLKLAKALQQAQSAAENPKPEGEAADAPAPEGADASPKD